MIFRVSLFASVAAFRALPGLPPDDGHVRAKLWRHPAVSTDPAADGGCGDDRFAGWPFPAILTSLLSRA